MNESTTKVQRVFTGFTAVLFVLTPMAATGQSTDEVFARWKGGSVTCAAFETWLEDSRLSAESGAPEAFLQRYAGTRVLAAAAVEAGLGESELDRAIRRQREDVLFAALLQRSVVDAVTISDEELDALVAKYPESFVRPRRVRLFNLFKRVPAGTSAERQQARQAIETLRARAMAGENFSELAREHSDSENRLKGGLIGMVSRGDLPAAIDAEVAALEEGQVSRVFESVDGFQVFHAERVVPEKRPTEEERRRNLASNLRKKKIDEAWNAVKASVVEPEELRFFPEDREAAGAVLVKGRTLELTTLELEADLAEVPIRGGFGDAAARVRLGHLAETRLLAGEARRRGLAPSASQWRAFEERWSERLALLELARRVEERLVEPTDEEIASYFEEHASQFERPREFELWALRLSFEADNFEALRATGMKVRALADELRANPSAFSRIAAEVSDLEGLSPAGYLGWVGPRRLFTLSPNVRKAVDTMRVGEASAVREGDSYWLVRLSDLRESRIPVLEEVVDEVRNAIGQTRVDEARRDLENSLREKLAIRVVGACDTASF